MSLEKNRGKRGAVAYSRKAAVVFSHINENEKWAYVKIRATNINDENEKLEILKNLKDLIKQFVDDKYNEIDIDFSDYLELNEREIEYLINYRYNNLNEPINDPFFYSSIDTYVYEYCKHINEKDIKIEKRLEIRFECGFDDDKGNPTCRFFEINGSTESKDCEI